MTLMSTCRTYSVSVTGDLAQAGSCDRKLLQRKQQQQGQPQQQSWAVREVQQAVKPLQLSMFKHMAGVRSTWRLTSLLV
jgi:hypothetical protein